MSFPSPPDGYDISYMRRLVQQLEALSQEVRRKDVTFGKVRITDLPTSATGLASGELWNDAGTVKVA
jgi:hypothetical protein